MISPQTVSFAHPIILYLLGTCTGRAHTRDGTFLCVFSDGRLRCAFWKVEVTLLWVQIGFVHSRERSLCASVCVCVRLVLWPHQIDRSVGGENFRSQQNTIFLFFFCFLFLSLSWNWTTKRMNLGVVSVRLVAPPNAYAKYFFIFVPFFRRTDSFCSCFFQLSFSTAITEKRSGNGRHWAAPARTFCWIAFKWDIIIRIM